MIETTVAMRVSSARAKRVIDLLPPPAHGLGLTGGEPTVAADALLDLLQHCHSKAPWLQLHLLSNGRRFADIGFARRYAAVGHTDIMAGIPIYGPEPGLHDFIVQSVHEVRHIVQELRTLGRDRDLLDEVWRRLSDAALLDRADLNESIQQMRQSKGRVLRPLGRNDPAPG